MSQDSSKLRYIKVTTGVVLLWLANACGFNFSLPGKKAPLVPDHQKKSASQELISSKQDSYFHTKNSIILSGETSSLPNSDNDQKFWADYLLPFKSNKKTTEQLIAQLSGQELSTEHTISTYRCRLSTNGANTSESPTALLNYPVTDPCLPNVKNAVASFQTNPVNDTEVAYFFSVLAESLEGSLRSGTEAIHKTMKSFKFEIINSLKILKSVVIFGKIQKSMVIYFHGSITQDDWQSNLTFKLENAKWFNLGSAQVHGGFNQSIQKIWPDLIEILADYPDVTQSFFVGFSRGGALATLAGLKWASTGHSSYVYTFGQPRVGNQQFVKSIENTKNLKILRFLNKYDIVGRLPPENDSLKYFNFLFTL